MIVSLEASFDLVEQVIEKEVTDAEFHRVFNCGNQGEQF